ncbi:MAG: porin [Aureliella sp.]
MWQLKTALALAVGLALSIAERAACQDFRYSPIPPGHISTLGSSPAVAFPPSTHTRSAASKTATTQVPAPPAVPAPPPTPAGPGYLAPPPPPSVDPLQSSPPYFDGTAHERLYNNAPYNNAPYSNAPYENIPYGNVPYDGGYSSAGQPLAQAVPTVPLPVTSPLVNERLANLEQRLDQVDAEKRRLPNVRVHGAFQADAVLFNQTTESRDQFGSIENGADFRRVRLSANGAVTESMNYFLQTDFGFFGRPTITDAWVEQTDVPILGTVRAGQWKQPFSLEVVSSYRYTTFMERSSLFQTFAPFRHIGIGFYNHSDDLDTTWAASYFRTGQDQFGNSLSTDGGNGIAARATHLLWHYGVHGQDYMHIGAGYHMNSPPRDNARFRSIPEIFVGEFAPGAVGTSGQAVPGAMNGTPFFVDTGTLAGVSDVHTFGLEGLWVRGPLSVQSETMVALVDQTSSNSTLAGSYAQVGYFLTGEHRPYDRKAGAIDRVMPFQSVGSGGRGAWEVAARWSYVDLDSGPVRGGNMENFTGGVNWYLNPYCKWVFNYIHSWTDGRDYFPAPSNATLSSQTDAWGTRVQLDF